MAHSELIRLIKEAKASTGITYKEIEDKTRRIGSPVSESSIKRLFSEGSETKNVKNDKTLMPVASVLLDPEVIRNAIRPQEKTSEATQDVIAMKEQRIDILSRQLEAKEAEYQRQIDALTQQHAKKETELLERIATLKQYADQSREDLQTYRAETQARIDYFKEQLKNDQEASRGRKKLCILLGILLVIAIAVIVTALVVDRLNSNIGFFWLDPQMYFHQGTTNANPSDTVSTALTVLTSLFSR